jgi:hypothetical protein
MEQQQAKRILVVQTFIIFHDAQPRYNNNNTDGGDIALDIYIIRDSRHF